MLLFPRDYEKYRQLLTDDAKVYVYGRVSAGDEENAKLILEKLVPFDEVPKELWFRFPDRQSFQEKQQELLALLKTSDGNTPVALYLEAERAVNRLPLSFSVRADQEFIKTCRAEFGEKNVKVNEKLRGR